MNGTTPNGRPFAFIYAMGLSICLMGCQPRNYKAPPSPSPPLPSAAEQPQQPVRPTFYVNINHLNLRICPSTECPKISTLVLNAEVEKMSEIGSWTQIRLKENGTIGYVSSRYLSSHPVKVAKHTRKRTRKAKLSKKHIKKAKTAKTIQLEKEREIKAKEQETSSQVPNVM